MPSALLHQQLALQTGKRLWNRPESYTQTMPSACVSSWGPSDREGPTQSVKHSGKTSALLPPHEPQLSLRRLFVAIILLYEFLLTNFTLTLPWLNIIFFLLEKIGLIVLLLQSNSYWF